jgi:hypothetical protein
MSRSYTFSPPAPSWRVVCDCLSYICVIFCYMNKKQYVNGLLIYKIYGCHLPIR